MLPPNEQLAHFFADREPPATDLYVQKGGKQVLSKRVNITSGVARVDGLLATIATVAVDGRPRFSSGVIHGCVDGSELPAYLQEVTLLHALRFLREWMVDTKQDQTLLQHITLRAGRPLVHPDLASRVGHLRRNRNPSAVADSGHRLSAFLYARLI